MKASLSAVPRAVWVLGFVSLFMDLSSEIIHALLPLFLTTTLGVSVAAVGAIDGVAEATASITKVFSGYISDRMGKRRPLILIGYGMAALTKPLFALAGSAPMVLGHWPRLHEHRLNRSSLRPNSGAAGSQDRPTGVGHWHCRCHSKIPISWGQERRASRPAMSRPPAARRLV